MKVLFLSEFFHPHWTGYAKSLFKAALRLQEKGYQCAVLSTKHDKNLPDFEQYQGISIFRTQPLISISRTNYSIRSIFKFIGLVKGYDII
ncbi:MAG: hypothetical protein K6T55_05125, partial [Syntrophobacterales bacterium]|nr:hypothetical protein [Syntrophobacterales bacterium]